MINNLYDVSIKTPIANLPAILTYNNNSIKNEFSYIFDSDNNRLILSVYIPSGSVTAHFGDFKNLSCENITLHNTDSLMSSIKNSISTVEHNSLKNVYSTLLLADTFSEIQDPSNFYCHDASVIVYNSSSLYSVIANLQEQIDYLKTFHSSEINTASSVNNIMNYNIDDSAMTYGAPLSNEEIILPKILNKQLLYSTQVLLRRLKLPAYQISDLLEGNLYAYYSLNINNIDITISDNYFNSLESSKIGLICNIKFNDTNTNAYYKIILSRKNKQSIKLSKNPLNRIQLKCVNISEKYGTEWEIYQYSTQNSNDIIISQ